MISARVAGVPNPLSFIAADSSLSSRTRPAVSIAVSKAASVRRGGGRVCLVSARASSTRCGWPTVSPGGRFCSASFSSLSVAVAALALRLPTAFSVAGAVPTSNTFQPTRSTAVPVL